MKQLLIVVALIGSTVLFSKAQGTLEYNQVKIVTSSESVPAGKVWKVISVLSSTDLGSLSATAEVKYSKDILINGATVYICGRSYIGYYGNGIDSGIYTELPIWLPAGTSLATSTGSNGISVIEFNEL